MHDVTMNAELPVGARPLLLRTIPSANAPGGARVYQVEPGTRRLAVLAVPIGDERVVDLEQVEAATKPLRDAGVDAFVVMRTGDLFEILEVVPKERLGEPASAGDEMDDAQGAFRRWLAEVCRGCQPPGNEESFVAGWNARAAYEQHRAGGRAALVALAKSWIVEAARLSLVACDEAMASREPDASEQAVRVRLAAHAAAKIKECALSGAARELCEALGVIDLELGS